MNTNDEGEELKPGDEGYVAPDAGGEGDGGDDDKGGDGNISTDDRTQEAPDAKLARLKRQQEQLLKKHPELSEEKSQKKSKKSDELDYGQEAYLIANGIKEADEIELAREIMSSTGKSLKEVVSGKYFKTELDELREQKASVAAMPSGQKRGNQSPSDSVEYWIQKGELPPANMPELRTKVVNAKIAKESNSNVFTQNPVVGKQ